MHAKTFQKHFELYCTALIVKRTVILRIEVEVFPQNRIRFILTKQLFELSAFNDTRRTLILAQLRRRNQIKEAIADGYAVFALFWWQCWTRKVPPTWAKLAKPKRQTQRLLFSACICKKI